jgi:hypothetical protein
MNRIQHPASIYVFIQPFTQPPTHPSTLQTQLGLVPGSMQSANEQRKTKWISLKFRGNQRVERGLPGPKGKGNEMG